MAALRHRTPDRPNRRPRALVASLAAVALSFGALMGAGPAEGWAAGADQVEAATSTVSATSEAPATETGTSGEDAQSPAAKPSEEPSGRGDTATAAGDTSAEPAPETEASKPASEVGAAEAPAEEEAAPSKESVPTSEPTTEAMPRAPAGGSDSASSKNVDTFEFATPVEPEDAMSEQADADASGAAVEGEATEVKLVQASGTFTAPQKLLWPIDVTVWSDSGGDFSAQFRVESGGSHTWEGQLPEGAEVRYRIESPDTDMLVDVYNNTGSMDLDLGGAGIVTGTLTDSAGSPRSGIQVQALVGYPFEPRPIETNADGRYQFIIAESTEFGLVFDGIWQNVVAGVGSVVTVEQPVGAQQVTVRLTDPEGNDLVLEEDEKAQVSLTGPYAQTMDLAAGNNTVVFNVPAGSYRLNVSIDSPQGSLNSYYPGVRSAEEAELLEIVVGGEAKTIDLPVERGSSLQAIFVDESGEPAAIPNGAFAEVELSVNGETIRNSWVNEGESGFSFRYLAPGQYDVGYDFMARGGSNIQKQQVTVVAGADATGIEFVVPRSNTVAGSFVDSQGDPAPLSGEDWGELVLKSEDGSSQRVNVEPGQSTFEFRDVQDGRYTLILAVNNYTLYYPGVAEQDRQQQLEVSGDLKDLAFSTSFGSTISGTVTGADGQPIAGAVVYLHLAQSLGTWDVESTTKTNTAGRYEFSRLDVGNYAVRAGAGDSYYFDHWHSTQASGEASPVIVASTEEQVTADIRLAEQGGKLDITWPEAYDKCNGAWIEVRTADGNYVPFNEGGVLPAGEYRLGVVCGSDTFWWDGAADVESSRLVTIVAGESTAVAFAAWKENQGGSISGTVGIEGTGDVETYATLYRLVTGEWGTWNQYVASTWTPEGRYSFEVNEPGQYVVQVDPQGAYQSAWHDGSPSHETPSPIIHDGTEAKKVDISLKYPVSLTVRLLDAATNTAVEGNPYLQTTGGISVSTAYGNEMTLKLLGTGEFDIQARNSGYLDAKATVAVPTVGSHTYDLHMDKGAKLGVTVLADNNSLPLRNVWVQSLADGSEPWDYTSEWTSHDGRAEFVLAPGQYFVCVPDAGLYVGQCDEQNEASGQLVTVGPEGIETTVRLTLGGQIKGVIQDSSGNPMEGVTVGLATPGEPAPAGIEGLARSFVSLFTAPVAEDNGQLVGNTAITNARGEYTLPPVDPGQYALFAYRSDLGTTWYPASGTFAGSELLSIAPGTTLNLAFTAVEPVDGVIRTPEQSLTMAFRITVQPVAQTTVETGVTVTFAAWAAGDPLPTVRWQRSNDDGATWADVEGQVRESFEFTAEAADHGTQFRAVFIQAGVELASNAAKLAVNVPAVAPVAVEHLEAVEVSDTAVTLQWQAPEDGGAPIQGYTVRLYEAGELLRTLNPGNVLSSTIGGLKAETGYTATVTAHNAAGAAPASKATAFTTAPTPASVPGAPGNVAVEATHDSAAVSWSAPDDGGEPVSGYTVRVFQDGAEVQSVSAEGTEALLGGLAPSSGYTLTVTAHNTVGESAASADAAFTTAAPPATAPAAVPEIAVEATHESATVTWTAPGDGGSAITGYTVSLGRGGTALESASTEGELSVRFEELEVDTEYTVTVVARNAVGDSAAEEQVFRTSTAPATAPARIRYVIIEATHESAVVSWDAPDDGGSPITGYTVQVWHGATPFRTFEDVTETTVTVDGLAPLDEYGLVVTVHNAVGSTESFGKRIMTMPAPTPTEEPTPTPTEEPTVEPTPTPTPTEEPTQEPTPTPIPTEEPTVEPTPTPTPTEEPTVEPTPTPAEEPSQVPTPTPIPTEEPTVEPTPTPTPTEEPTPPGESQTPREPNEADLVGDAGNGVTVPANVKTGDRIELVVTGADEGQRVNVYAFSTPVHLGTKTVGAGGIVSVALPAGLVGEHRIAVYLLDGTLVGWDRITIAAPATGTPAGESPEATATAGPTDSVVPVESGSGTESVAPAGSSVDPAESGDSDGSLARTGAGLVPLGVGAIALIIGGFVLYRRKAYAGSHRG